MILTGAFQVFVVGTLGGILLELFHWYSLRREARLPDYAHSSFYWAISAGMAVAGGALAWLYFGSRADGIVALHVGLSAPLILQKLTTTIAKTPGGKSSQMAEWVRFLQW